MNHENLTPRKFGASYYYTVRKMQKFRNIIQVGSWARPLPAKLNHTHVIYAHSVYSTYVHIQRRANLMNQVWYARQT